MNTLNNIKMIPLENSGMKTITPLIKPSHSNCNKCCDKDSSISYENIKRTSPQSTIKVSISDLYKEVQNYKTQVTQINQNYSDRLRSINSKIATLKETDESLDAKIDELVKEMDELRLLIESYKKIYVAVDDDLLYLDSSNILRTRKIEDSSTILEMSKTINNINVIFTDPSTGENDGGETLVESIKDTVLKEIYESDSDTFDLIWNEVEK